MKKILLAITGLVLLGAGCSPSIVQIPDSPPTTLQNQLPPVVQKEAFAETSESEQYRDLLKFSKEVRGSHPSNNMPHLSIAFHGDDGRSKQWRVSPAQTQNALLVFFRSFTDRSQLLVFDRAQEGYDYEVYLVARNCTEYEEIRRKIKDYSLDFDSQVLARGDGEKTPLDECLADQWFE